MSRVALQQRLHELAEAQVEEEAPAVRAAPCGHLRDLEVREGTDNPVDGEVDGACAEVGEY